MSGPAVLVVGGYGGFGGRLVALLEAMDVARILVAGRSGEKARAFCAGRAVHVEPVEMDRSQPCGETLRALAPDIVVDAAGPFQLYGAEPFSLVETCIELGIHYVDLADARAFVCGIDRYDEAAGQAGIFVLSGASSVPALSGAVIRTLAPDFDRIDDIDIGISPAGGTLMGPSVVRAILSYAGREVAVMEEGRWRVRRCWTDLRPERIEVAGAGGLNRRRFSLCDVPDLAIWPEVYEGVRSVHFGAALEPAVNHFGMLALAWLVRVGLLRRAESLAPLLDKAARVMPAGVRRGGMFVRLRGRRRDAGAGEAVWTLIAEGDHGPYIPAMASAALVQRVIRGEGPAPGARACTRDLQLDDFEPFFARFDIRTGIRRDGKA